MSAEKGSAFLLKIGNGGNPPVAGGDYAREDRCRDRGGWGSRRLCRIGWYWVASETPLGEETERPTRAVVVIEGEQVVGERQPAVPSPSGGTIIDAEARAAIAAIAATLKSHGLTD